MKQPELKDYLQQQKNDHRYRQRLVVESPQGVDLSIGGKKYLNFCSNDYLGLASHPHVIEALINGARKYGAGSGASHLINGHSLAHHQLEEELAEFVGRPRALLFSTGYMANLGVISALLGKGDVVFEDRLNHASLLDGGLLSQARLQRFQHNDLRDLEIKLGDSKAKTKLICTDGVFSMDGDVADVKQLAMLARQHEAWLMVDDAHGLGVVGKNGRGILESAGVAVEDVPVLVGTLGKAFGTFGAFVAGDDDLIEMLIQRARSYVYTTALPPAIAEATRISIKLMDGEAWRRDKLADNISYFKQQINKLDLPDTNSSTAIQPIMIGEVEAAMKLSASLKEAGLLVSAIRPPTVPEGTSRLRITLCAEHSQQQIDRLISTISENIVQKQP
ncbi:MAG: 8-amino-7-oxononanoate synthase [Thioalkalispiraceae bacterium]